MKALVLSIVLIFTVSCENPVENRYSEKKICFTVVDELTNNPLDNAYVEVLTRTLGVYASFGGYTDATGSCCIEYGSEYGDTELISALVHKKGYLSPCPGSWSTNFRLIPIAYIMMHIKNNIPAHVDDFLFVDYPSQFCYSTDIIDFKGANIDTIVTVSSRPSNAMISCRLWNDNHKTEWKYDNIVLKSNDTTFIEIIY